MGKGLTAVLIIQLKIPLMTQNLFAQFVCPSLKVLDFNEKRLHWKSVVRGAHDARNEVCATSGVEVLTLNQLSKVSL